MYNPKIWYDGDIVNSGGLNNIEQGIAQNAHDIEDLLFINRRINRVDIAQISGMVEKARYVE